VNIVLNTFKTEPMPWFYGCI